MIKKTPFHQQYYTKKLKEILSTNQSIEEFFKGGLSPFTPVDGQESDPLIHLKALKQSITFKIEKYEVMSTKIDEILNPEGTEEGIKVNQMDSEEDLEWLEDSNVFLKIGYQQLKESNKLHYDTFSRLQYKINSIHQLIEDYIKQLESDHTQKGLKELIQENINLLKEKLKCNSEKNQQLVSTIEPVYSELTKIVSKVRENFNSEEAFLRSELTAKRFGFNKKDPEQSDKSTTVNFKVPTDFPDAKIIRLERIKTEITDYEKTSNLMGESSDVLRIRFIANDSYLCSSAEKGISFKTSTRMYSCKPRDEEGFTNIILGKTCFFIYDSNKGRIYKKNFDNQFPKVWWDKEKVIGDFSDTPITVGLKGEAVAALLKSHDLIVIEVRADQSPGREMRIKTGLFSKFSRVYFLENRLLLGVTNSMKIMLYRLNLISWTYEEVSETKLPIQVFENETFETTALTEYLDHLAVLTRDQRDDKKQRIFMYKIDGKKVSLSAELDISGLGITGPFPLSFSKTFHSKMMLLCGYSNSSTTGLYLFRYNVEMRKLEKKDFVKTPSGGECIEIQAFGEEIVGILKGGNLFKAKFTFG